MAVTVRQILQENLSDYLKSHKVTFYQKKEVQKAINCSKQSCNSRICSPCGKRYTDQWSSRLQGFLFPVGHSHAVLTVPAILRPKLRDWGRLRLLMDSSSSFFANISR